MTYSHICHLFLKILSVGPAVSSTQARSRCPNKAAEKLAHEETVEGQPADILQFAAP